MKLSRICLWVALVGLISADFACNSWKTKPATAKKAESKAPTTSPATYAEADDLEEMLTYIASDELEGRGLMTVGINRAADYIAEHFKDAGLKPLPALDGYFQPFKVNAGMALGPGNTLTLGDQPLQLRQDFMPMGLSASGDFSGPIVFVGYSISSEKYKYDDYAGIDVKGKIALCARYEPEDA